MRTNGSAINKFCEIAFQNNKMPGKPKSANAINYFCDNCISEKSPGKPKNVNDINKSSEKR